MSPSLFSIISAKQKFFWYYYAYSLSLWILNEEICRCKRKVVNLPWLLENEYEKEIVSSFLLLQCLNIDILRNLVDMEKYPFFRISHHCSVYIFNIALNIIYLWGISADRLETFKDNIQWYLNLLLCKTMNDIFYSILLKE